MSHLEFVDWLLRVGVGWLGFRPDEVKNMLIPDIVAGYEGKVEMLQFCFGKPKKEESVVDDVETFDRLFGGG